MFTRGDRWEKRATTGRTRGGSEGQCLDRRRGCGGAEFRAGVGLEGRDVLERRYGRYGKGRDLREGRGFKQKGVAFERRGVASHSPGAAAPRALAPPAPNPGSPHRDRPPAPPLPPRVPNRDTGDGARHKLGFMARGVDRVGGCQPSLPPVPDRPRSSPTPRPRRGARAAPGKAEEAAAAAAAGGVCVEAALRQGAFTPSFPRGARLQQGPAAAGGLEEGGVRGRGGCRSRGGGCPSPGLPSSTHRFPGGFLQDVPCQRAEGLGRGDSQQAPPSRDGPVPLPLGGGVCGPPPPTSGSPSHLFHVYAGLGTGLKEADPMLLRQLWDNGTPPALSQVLGSGGASPAPRCPPLPSRPRPAALCAWPPCHTCCR